MNRIYHNHDKWEEVKYNMYGDCENKNKDMLTNKVIHFFNTKYLIEKYMAFVVDNFKYSCEHNFTNPSMNKIAWLGQAAVAVWSNIPEDITRNAWNFLNKETQDRANNLAKNEIERWKSCQKSI